MNCLRAGKCERVGLQLSLLLALATWSVLKGQPVASPAPKAEAKPGLEKEYRQLQELDDAAQAEIDTWTRQNRTASTNQADRAAAELTRRVHQRLEPVRRAYDDFLHKHPEYVKARLTYGSFLNDLGDESAAQEQWEKALELDPKNPDALNNLAGRYSETGPVEKAFEYYSKAIELNPTSAVYHANFGDTLYVRRKAAMSFYHVDEQEVYAKALANYSNAARLDSTNLAFASKAAETYYTLKPFPAEAALKGWTNALLRTRSEPEREHIYVHLARVKMLAGHYAEARSILDAVTNAETLQGKSHLLEAIKAREPETPSKSR